MKKITIILAIVFTCGVYLANAQEWVVPADMASAENPVALDNKSVRDGNKLYNTHCKSCHGDPGKFNHLPLQPPPPDITEAKMQDNTDGSMHYKIANGRGGMPPFKALLTDNDIWKVVNYIRKYHPSNAGKFTDEPLKVAQITSKISSDSTYIDIQANVQQADKSFAPLANATLFVKQRKLFGAVPVKEVVTDAEGKARFDIPADLIGNAAGRTAFVIEPGDDFESLSAVTGEVSTKTKFASKDDFWNHKSLWSTNPRTQLWLILTYVITVLGVWATIFYIILQLAKIARTRS